MNLRGSHTRISRGFSRFFPGLDHLEKIPPQLHAILAALLFGSSTPLSKLLLDEIPPIQLAGLLYSGSGLFMVLFKFKSLQKSIQKRREVKRTDLFSLLGSILAGGILAPVALMLGLNHSSAAVASLLLNFEAAATAVLASLFFHEQIGKRLTVSIILITVASLILSFDPFGNFHLSYGSLLILLACILWGTDNNFTRNITSLDPATIVAIKGMSAGGFILTVTYATGSQFPSPSRIVLSLLLGGLSYGLSLLLFISALRYMGSARTSSFFASAPFIGSGVSLVLFLEFPTLQYLVSLPILIAGLVILFKESHSHTHVHEFMEHTHSHTHTDGHHGHDHGHDQKIGESESHEHLHRHPYTVHSHNHMPDVHHRHSH